MDRGMGIQGRGMEEDLYEDDQVEEEEEEK